MTGVLIGLLVTYDRQPVVYWHSLTMNTVISILSVAMKALLIFAAAECIGQWKWILLQHKKRTLIDFERIDRASRGPLGCFNLTWRPHTPYDSWPRLYFKRPSH